MTRPPAIIRFERLYLGSTALWLGGAALSWDARRRMIAASPALAGYEWLVPAGFALVLVVSLALWWLVRERRSRGARAGVALLAVISAGVIAMTVLAAVSGNVLSPVATLLQLLSSALDIAAAALLFGAGARDWFGGANAVERVS